MIAPLRRRHRWTTAALAAALPVLYVVALAARPEEPVVDELPPALAESPAGEVDADLGELLADPPVAVRTRSSSPSEWWLELDPREPIARPEVLVYWSRSSAVAGGLPADAYLLGGLAGARPRVFALPPEALGLAGTLVLYSLGHQEVVASTRLPAIGWAPATPDPGAGAEAAGGETAEPAEAPP